MRPRRSWKPARRLGRLMALGIAAGAASGPAVAGPFGVDMGDPVEKHFVQPLEKPNQYRTWTLRGGHPEADHYILVATPQGGVCAQLVVLKDNLGDRDGARVRGQMQRTAAFLEARYGKPASAYDELEPGAIWTGPDEYAMALARKERRLARYWLELKPNPDRVRHVTLSGQAHGGDTTYVHVLIEFENRDACFPRSAPARTGAAGAGSGAGQARPAARRA